MKAPRASFARFAAATLFLAALSPLLLLSQTEIPITTSSKEARDFFLKGREKAELFEFVAAAELLDKAITLDPNFAMAHLLRSQSGGGFALTRQHREKAVNLADKVSAGERHWILAAQAVFDGHRTTRKQHLDELVKLHPRDKRAHFSLATYYTGDLDYSNVIAHYKKALDFDKNYAPVLNQLGYIYMTLENWPEAEKVFKRQIEVLPNSPNPYDSYAEMLLRNGRYDEAIGQYQKAYEKSPLFVGAFTGIGVSYEHKGDYTKARESFQQQLAKAPNVDVKITALNNTVHSYLYEGRYREAIKAVEEVRSFAEKENRPTTVIDSYSNAAWIHLENGNAVEAARSLEPGRHLLVKLDIPASTKEGTEFGQTILRCFILISVREFDAAQSLIAKCQQMVERRKVPADGRVLQTTIAVLERERGNFDKALEAAAKNPNDTFTWYQIGLTHEMKGDRENARKAYQRVVDWNWSSFPYALVRARAKQRMAM
jgi:tetratricopeptide (TPR) repeat protein